MSSRQTPPGDAELPVLQVVEDITTRPQVLDGAPTLTEIVLEPSLESARMGLSAPFDEPLPVAEVILPGEPDGLLPTLEALEPDTFPDLSQAPGAASEGGVAPAEDVRQVGSLRVPGPLFNIYLNEADELSRRLTTEVAEWGLDPQAAS